jgi:transcriptional regulator with XRE-family HTH domain
MAIDPDWFRQKLKERELSQRGLARLMGMDAGAVSLTLNGKRKMTLEEAAQIAVLLDATTQEVLKAAGVDVRSKDKVKVVGFMKGGGEVISQAKGLHETTEGHSTLPPDTIAIQCRTHGSAVEHMDGWMIFISGSHVQPTTVIGMTALVAVKGNGQLIGYVKRGYTKGAYNVAGLCGEIHSNVELAWAAPVVWIRTNS